MQHSKESGLFHGHTFPTGDEHEALTGIELAELDGVPKEIALADQVVIPRKLHAEHSHPFVHMSNCKNARKKRAQYHYISMCCSDYLYTGWLPYARTVYHHPDCQPLLS